MNFKNYFQFIEEQYVLENLIKIAGPALMYAPEKIMVQGPVSTNHFMLYSKLTKAIAKKKNITEDEVEKIIDRTPERELIRGFVTSDGRFVNRAQAWEIAKKYKKDIQAWDKQGANPRLASEYL